jgi:hypothetical protein
MTTRLDVKKDLAQMAPDVRALKFSPEGQVFLKFLRLQQDILRIDLETAPMDEIPRLQGALRNLKEIIGAISS